MGDHAAGWAVIGRQTVHRGRHALVPEDKQFPDGSDLECQLASCVNRHPEERAGLKEHAEKYAQVARYFLSLNQIPPHAQERPSQNENPMLRSSK